MTPSIVRIYFHPATAEIRTPSCIWPLFLSYFQWIHIFGDYGLSDKSIGSEASELYLSCWTDEQSDSVTGQQLVLIKPEAFCTSRPPLPLPKYPPENLKRLGVIQLLKELEDFIILSRKPSIQISRSDNTI